MQLEGRIIVVTGAGSGIGKALVKQFVAEGARAVVSVDIDAGNALQTAQEFGCIAMTADVTREDDIIRIIEETERDVGPLICFAATLV